MMSLERFQAAAREFIVIILFIIISCYELCCIDLSCSPLLFAFKAARGLHAGQGPLPHEAHGAIGSRQSLKDGYKMIKKWSSDEEMDLDTYIIKYLFIYISNKFFDRSSFKWLAAWRGEGL